MNIFKFILFLFILSSCQVYNSSTNDQVQYSSDGTAFGDAKVVLAINCVPCHSFYNQTQAELETSGVLVPGDIYSSDLFSRLKGSNVGGVENMPPSGQLSSDDLDKLKTWIEGI